MRKRKLYILCEMEIDEDNPNDDPIMQIRKRIPTKENGGCDIRNFYYKKTFDKMEENYKKYESFIKKLRNVLGLEGNE